MNNTFDKTALETIDLLEARLRRIEYAVCGHIDTTSITSSDVSISAYERLADLEHVLHGLASKSRVIQDLLKLPLRQRTAAVIQRWYTVDVLRTGESWAELEERVQHVEQKVRRAIAMKQLDDDMVQE
ncbi:hypothetical protein SS1G_11422 [Sclerotinia sclerotiorum 1980 UF-70]|uniref:Uncharacterized protein n=1 Tax=Sclerotinia sclerotiorum (strain ATCC 18683 / 1980 / Ss-1) TaxID=665079 RepID=A7F1F2_SCLS1|nr:hypothetical protein SS1G_11422 [Sclerotinia sclerotiorum 1980 UF-70]EDN95544.1 hypothetical protein SS1G_11422 [Sclerotinia sclerotiorum 1980 UF-70]